jgi:predicted porin
MKSVALAFLALCVAPIASAQSSLTLYGTLDLNGKVVKNDHTRRRLSLSQDGLNISQLGFRGIEDLGDGLKAGFSLLSSVIAETGSSIPKFFNRRSIVSVYSKAGELRLGRDYVPTFWNNAIFDAFGTAGVGNSYNVRQLQTSYASSPAVGNFANADNAVGYFLPPDLGGIYGQAMVAASEGGTNQGRIVAVRLGLGRGSFNAAFAGGEQRFDAAANPAVTGITAGSRQQTYNLGAWYDFGAFKLLGYVDRDIRNKLRETRGSITTVVPLGQAEIHVGYDRSKLSNDLAANTNIVSQYKATYQYNLSKRTAVYGSGSRLSNGRHPLSDVTQSVAGLNALFAGSAQAAPPVAGGKSTGFELGVRHFF